MSTQYYLFVPRDRCRCSDLGVAESSLAKEPDPARLLADLDALYEDYERAFSVTEDGFEVGYTKAEGLSDVDGAELRWSARTFAETDLIFLGYHIPGSAQSLRAFLDVLEGHLGKFFLLTDGDITPLDRDQILADY